MCEIYEAMIIGGGASGLVAACALARKGRRVVLATNPIFPTAATESRIRWAGLRPEDFELYTTYESIGFCKPNLDYYRELLRRLDLQAGDCLMVGNDVEEDMVASQLGMSVFLLTDCMINRRAQDISAFPHGNFDDLTGYLLKELNGGDD